tara:strand:- start:4 stop:660 length:657 start_codon:yes stop_codon:yes gene_type:complete
MGMAVPFAGATMTGFGGAAAAAAATSTMATIGASFVPTLLTASTGIPAGGFFSGLASAYQAVKPYTSILSAGSSVLQGIGAYRQGQAMQSQYDLQSLQVQAQNEITRLNWINDATDRTRRLMAANASALARGYAGGVSGLSGSVKLITKTSEEDYIRDMQMAEFNQESSDNFASAESALLRTAGKTAISGSKFEALGYIGSAVKLFEESKVPSYGTIT